MIAIDSNLLIYAHRTGTAAHHGARRAIEQAANDPAGWGVALASLGEFWSVVTHSPSAGRPSTPAEAAGFLRALVEGGAQIWQPTAGFAGRLLQLATERGIHGARIFDLQIALTASESGARELWTDDRNFVSLAGLRVRNPLR